MSTSNVQQMAALALASMAFADLANAASESGVESLNEMFNEGGVGFEASQAVKTMLGNPPTKDSAVEVALHLLRVSGHPLARLYDAQKAGELHVAVHRHRHGMSGFLVRMPSGQDIDKTFMAYDDQTYELDREDEYVELDSVAPDFALLDLTGVEIEEDEEA